MDSDDFMRAIGMNPEKVRERQKHSRELRKLDEEIKHLKWTRWAAVGGLVSGVTALAAFLVDVL